jgi:hypothetical protein
MASPRRDFIEELGLARIAELVEEQRRTAGTNSMGCWLYTGGSLNSGYGLVWARSMSDDTGKNFRIHRLAYIYKHGANAKNDASHLCDIPRCFNPDHIVDETNLLNQQRRGCPGRLVCGFHTTGRMYGRPAPREPSSEDMEQLRLEQEAFALADARPIATPRSRRPRTSPSPAAQQQPSGRASSSTKDARAVPPSLRADTLASALARDVSAPTDARQIAIPRSRIPRASPSPTAPLERLRTAPRQSPPARSPAPRPLRLPARQAMSTRQWFLPLVRPDIPSSEPSTEESSQEVQRQLQSLLQRQLPRPSVQPRRGPALGRNIGRESLRPPLRGAVLRHRYTPPPDAVPIEIPGNPPIQLGAQRAGASAPQRGGGSGGERGGGERGGGRGGWRGGGRGGGSGERGGGWRGSWRGGGRGVGNPNRNESGP